MVDDGSVVRKALVLFMSVWIVLTFGIDRREVGEDAVKGDEDGPLSLLGSRYFADGDVARSLATRPIGEPAFISVNSSSFGIFFVALQLATAWLLAAVDHAADIASSLENCSM